MYLFLLLRTEIDHKIERPRKTLRHSQMEVNLFSLKRKKLVCIILENIRVWHWDPTIGSKPISLLNLSCLSSLGLYLHSSIHHFYYLIIFFMVNIFHSLMCFCIYRAYKHHWLFLQLIKIPYTSVVSPMLIYASPYCSDLQQ